MDGHLSPSFGSFGSARGFFGGFDAEVLDQLRPQRAPALLALAVLLALASFLAIGPFVGATCATWQAADRDRITSL